MPTILGGNQLSTGYEVSNSMRFGGANGNAVLQKTFSSDGNRKKFTIATWIKVNASFSYISGTITSGSDYFQYGFTDSGTIRVFQGDGSLNVETSRTFGDASAWYHIVLQIDTTQGTNTNRVKFYVNGEQETNMTSTTYPNQNLDLFFNKDSHNMGVGNRGDADGAFIKGYLADYYFVDNATVAPSTFAETDDNGIWIPKDPTDVKDNVTFGTNGFLFEFKQTGTSANSSGMGADTSGNDNHFVSTNTNATNITTDTPTNNFATMNPVAITNSNSVLSEGNTIHTVTGGSAWLGAYSTLGFASGKWYAELKVLDVDNTSWGVIQSGGDSVANFNSANSGYVGKYADGWGWWGNGNAAETINNNSNTSYGSTESVNDIYMIAVDVDGGKIWIGKNGTFFNAPGTSNAGDPANGNNPGFSSITFTDFVHFASGLEAADSDDAAVGWNFGNAAHSISSGNADANGYGNFEYAVPSGYYALCTKNLAEYG